MGIAEVWNKATKSQRKRLLVELGYKQSSGFENVRFEDLPKRSGGMVQRDLGRLYGKYKSGRR